MSRLSEFLLDEEINDDYTTIYEEIASVNEAAPVVGILLGILSHIAAVRKEVEGVINLVEDHNLKKYLKAFVVSCVFLTGLLKAVTSTKK
ncbi:MAG: hypothetical protein ACLQUS_10095 [Desulfobaccales bacterium]